VNATTTVVNPTEETALVAAAREGYLPNRGNAATQLAFDLGADLTATSMDLRIANPSFEDWENMGRAVSFVGNAWQWWVGDWLVIGESLFGEEAAQAVDDHESRYDIARRVTGKPQGTLQNIRSVCARVSKERRRAELDFTHHEKVASLDPEDQIFWLEKAVEEKMTTSELASAIRDFKKGATPEDEPETDPEPGPGESKVSRSEQRDTVLYLVFQQAQRLSDGDYKLPSEVYAQVAAAVGED
jgi:hypothetical protein